MFSNAIYRGLLQRRASTRELLSKEFAVWAQGGPASTLYRVVREEEFSIMVLPDLIAKATKDWNGRRVFFLHVPKTAGTSFRLALTKASGVPAIMAYGREGTSPVEELTKYSFWPLFAGHAHIDDFPESHRGVTTLREPRARLLSNLRQHQLHPLHRPHGRLTRNVDEQMARWRDAVEWPFDTWLRRMPTPQASYFLSGRRADFFAVQNRPAVQRELAEAAPAIRESLTRALQRFDACAWSHDSVGIQAALRIVTGCEDVSMGVENEFKSNKYAKPVMISKEARLLLDDLGRADNVLFEVAYEVLGLPRLSGAEADHLFEQTARRLGFKLG